MAKIIFHGHACFEIASSDKKVLFDPFISGNPLAKINPDEIEGIDAILLTHGHGDHIADTKQIAQKNDSLIVAPFELASYMGQQGLNTHPMHIGGAYEFPFGWVKLVNALHGSCYIGDNEIIPTGSPCGFMLEIDETMIYHSGDTGLFGDMKLFKEFLLNGRDIDVALLPIGDNFVMGPKDALTAVKWINPKIVVPMHYDTFPVIEQDPKAFKKEVEEETDTECIILEPGEEFEIS